MCTNSILLCKTEFKCEHDGDQSGCVYYEKIKNRKEKECFHCTDGYCTSQDAWYLAAIKNIFGIHSICDSLQKEEISELKKTINKMDKTL